MSVGLEGVKPFSRVQPENAPDDRFTLDFQMMPPSMPRTSICKFCPTTVAAAPSFVLPVGRLTHPAQPKSLQELRYMALSKPLTTSTISLRLLQAASVGFDWVKPLRSVHPLKVPVDKSMLLCHIVSVSVLRTTMCSRLLSMVAAGLSQVYPDGRAIHSDQVRDGKA